MLIALIANSFVTLILLFIVVEHHVKIRVIRSRYKDFLEDVLKQMKHTDDKHLEIVDSIVKKAELTLAANAEMKNLVLEVKAIVNRINQN